MYQLKTTISTLSNIRKKKKIKQMWFPRMNGQVAVQSAPPRILEFWGRGGRREEEMAGEHRTG